MPDSINDEKEIIRYVEMVKAMRLPYLKVPCGKCVECRKARYRAWRTRIWHEYTYGRHKNAVFVTLTFDDPSLEKFRSIGYDKAIVAFQDRIRKTFGKGVKYFLVSDIGKNTGRFHFHGILFDLPFCPNRKGWKYEFVKRKLDKFWKYGNTWVGYCNDQTISYVIKYMFKESKYDPTFKPRVYCSPALGKCFVDGAFKQQVYDKMAFDLNLRVSGCKAACPAYYIQKALEDDPWSLRYFSLYNQLVHSPTSQYFKGIYYHDSAALDAVREAYFQDTLRRRTSRPVKRLGTPTALHYHGGDTAFSVDDVDRMFYLR